MPYNKCCVPTCGDISANTRHIFPNPKKDMDRFKKWLDAVNNPELNNMDPVAVFTNKRICHIHFVDTFVSTRSQTLQLNAVPTLFLRNESKTSVADNTHSVNISNVSSDIVLLDHSYFGPSNEHNKVIRDDTDTEDTEYNMTATCEGNGGGSNMLSPLQLLNQSGITKNTITPRKNKLFSAVRELHKKYNREQASKKSFKRRLFEANQFGRKNYLEQNVDKLNTMAAMLIKCQLREVDKFKNLRRFTLNEKFLALSFYKQSPKSYSLLSKIFILPSKSTLNKLLGKIVGGPGTTTLFLSHWKKQPSKWILLKNLLLFYLMK